MDVSTIDEKPPGEQCNHRRRDKETGEFEGYCKNRAGKGTDTLGEGRCYLHGGRAGSPKGNQNAKGNSGNPNPSPESGNDEFESGNRIAVSHGIWAKLNLVYSEDFSDTERALVDEFYVGIIRNVNIAEGNDYEIKPHEDAQLFQTAVNTVKKLIRAENWSLERPKDRESGNVLIDKSITHTEGGANVDYVESPAQAAARAMVKDDRQWLKERGWLDPTEQQKEKAERDVARAWAEALESVGETPTSSQDHGHR